jgi:hypothetical protein
MASVFYVIRCDSTIVNRENGKLFMSSIDFSHILLRSAVIASLRVVGLAM